MNRNQFISQVEGTQKALRRFLVALCCGDSQMADDIAQETLLRAWLSCDSFRSDASFSTWIRRIAYNTFLNSRRRAVVTQPVDESSSQVRAAETADSAFRYQALYKALALLSDKERTSILLHYLEGYSVREIAVIEQTTDDAVKKHLSRGREHLRNLLSPDD